MTLTTRYRRLRWKCFVQPGMSDDLRDWDNPATIGDVVAVLDLQLERGTQFYALPAGNKWLVFYNGKTLVH